MLLSRFRSASNQFVGRCNARLFGCEIHKEKIRERKSASLPKNVDEFAKHWIDVWNSHNIDNILSHYSEDVEVMSLKIKQIVGPSEVPIRYGKSAVREYWSMGLAKQPALQFELIDVTVGVESVALYYKSLHTGKNTVEVMFFDANGKVNKVFAHYQQ